MELVPSFPNLMILSGAKRLMGDRAKLQQLLQEAVRSHSFGRLEKGWSLVEGIPHTLLHRHGGCADPDMDRGAGPAPTEKDCIRTNLRGLD